MATVQRGKCPFCGEVFEELEECPYHALDLEMEPEDEAIAPYDLRFGRGWVFLASVGTWIGFLMPLVTAQVAGPATASGLAVANQLAPYLWAVPLVGVSWASALIRRRTRGAMRGARLGVPGLSLLGGTALAYVIYRIHAGTLQINARFGTDVTVQLESGAWVMAFALVLGAVGGLRLGGSARFARRQGS